MLQIQVCQLNTRRRLHALAGEHNTSSYMLFKLPNVQSGLGLAKRFDPPGFLPPKKDSATSKVALGLPRAGGASSPSPHAFFRQPLDLYAIAQVYMNDYYATFYRPISCSNTGHQLALERGLSVRGALASADRSYLERPWETKG